MNSTHHTGSEPEKNDHTQRGAAGAPAPGNDISRHLQNLARNLETEPGIEGILDDIVAAAVRLIPNAVEASISVVRGRRTMESFAASGELPRRVDDLQSEVQEGPCMDAAFDEDIVRVPDVGKESRWPLFAERAWDAGARSMLSFQLFVDGDDLGVLNVYGNTVGAFEDSDEEIALLVASHAAIGFADVQNLSALNASLINRDIVGQAKGILMERYRISSYQAFSLIDAVSTQTSVKLIDVAEHIIAGGTLAIDDTRSLPSSEPTASDTDMTDRPED
jgi:hypothetical protein